MTTPPNTYERYDNEINLAELIEVLLKRKWLIFSGSFACALIVGLFTFSMPRLYQSEALVLVSSSIIKPNSNGKDAVSQITVSSLEAMTYEVLAKGDELMLALADTLKARLPPEVLKLIANEEDSFSIASELIEDLEIDLMQDTGQRNVLSTTPLLIMRYKSADKSLPSIVVNTWSELFLQRNQGLSSNVTDEFYQNVVFQYEQAKNNLERKEEELTKINAANNELNLLKTEVNSKSTQLDTSLKYYQHLQTEFEQKKQEYEYVTNVITEVEYENKWVGYVEVDSLQTLDQDFSISRSIIVELSKKIDQLSSDSSIEETRTDVMQNRMIEDHRMLKIDFEATTNFSLKQAQAEHINDLLSSYLIQYVESDKKIDSLNTVVHSLTRTLEELEPVLTTRKAVTDDFLWEHTYADEKLDTKIQQSLGKYGLVSEEANPTYLQFHQLLTQAKAQLLFSSERSKFLVAEIDSLEKRVKLVHSELIILREKELRIREKITTERTELNQERFRISSDINLQLGILRKSFENYEQNYKILKSRQEILKRELSGLEISSLFYKKNYESWRGQLTSLYAKVDSLELKRRRIERDVKVYRESFDRFAKLQEEARIARQQAAGDIQIVSKAKIAKAMPKGTLNYMIVFGLSGFIMFSLIAITHELTYRKIFPRS